MDRYEMNYVYGNSVDVRNLRGCRVGKSKRHKIAQHADMPGDASNIEGGGKV